MLIILHGEDNFRSRQKLKALIEGKNPERFVAEEVSWQEVKKALDNNSLFSNEKYIVLEGILANKDILDKLGKYASDKNIAKDKNTTLLVLESSALKSNAENKQLMGAASSVEESKKLSVPEAVRWFSQFFAKKEINVSSDVIRQVVVACRADMWQSYNELVKLYTYKAGKAITKQDIQTMNIGSEEAQIFPTIDAIFSGKTDPAFKNLLTHWQAGEHPHYLFTMIERQLRIAASVKEEAERSANADTIAKKLSLHPFVVKKTMPLTKRFSWPKIRGLYERVESLDVKSKSGQMDPRLAAELLAAAVAA